MRIAVTADPYIPVPPKIYGGIERIVALLVEGLDRAGHDVVLIAHPESKVACELVPYGAPPHKGVVPRATELYQVGSWLFRHRGELDIVHSFGRLAALFPVLRLSYLPKLQTYQRPEIPWTGVARASRLAGTSLSLTGCSSAMYKNPKAGQWHTVYNAVDVERYNYVAELPADAPLMFLGRIEPIKGTHDAIQIALQSGRDLIVAGNRVDGYSDYFEQKVEPFIDGKQIRYVGAVDDRQKNELLGRASALLMPIDVEEAFGIVMAEAMACGTPVIGFARGSVPEVIREGETGFVVQNVAEAVDAVLRIPSLSRAAARRDAEERFSSKAMLRGYLELYDAQLAIARGAQSATAVSTASISPAKK